jgi:hypothetical protein
MQVSHLKLCASRAFWMVAYPSQGHEMLFDAHTRSFAEVSRTTSYRSAVAIFCASLTRTTPSLAGGASVI